MRRFLPRRKVDIDALLLLIQPAYRCRIEAVDALCLKRAGNGTVAGLARWSIMRIPIGVESISFVGFPRYAATMGTFTAVIKNADGWWFGWVEEVPGVNAQERTKEELIIALRECLSEALEMNRFYQTATSGLL